MRHSALPCRGFVFLDIGHSHKQVGVSDFALHG